MREHMRRDENANRTALIEGLIVSGFGQCKSISEIAAEIDLLLCQKDAVCRPDLYLAS